MDLLILKKSLGPSVNDLPAYRGTERGHPVHFGNLPDSHVANELFFWFVEEGGERGVVHDLKKAKQLVELLNLFGDTVFYELVQVGTERAVVPGKGGFLGFDVSAGFNNSVIRRVLLQQQRKDSPKASSAEECAVWELSRLHRQFFSSRLNDHQLFNHHDDAEFCLQTVRALNTLRPSWMEGTNMAEYAVASLYKVL